MSVMQPFVRRGHDLWHRPSETANRRVLVYPPRRVYGHHLRRLHAGTGGVNNPAQTQFKILFFGRDEFSCLVMEQLHAAQDVWDELHIVTQPDTKVDRRGSKLSVSPLKILGSRLGIPVHTIPPEKRTFKTWQPPPPFLYGSLSDSSDAPAPPAEHLLVTASFGRILPASLLNAFQPLRRLNVHPSQLPAYRGAAPIQHTLLDGRTETGVCVIEMMPRAKGIDSGAIWGNRTMPVPESSTFPGLRDALAREGGALLVSVLRDMLAGKARSLPQPLDPAAPRAPMIRGEDANIDFAGMTAESVVRRHRAISHQKPLVTYLATGKTLQLHSPAVCVQHPPELLGQLHTPGLAIYHPPGASLLVRCAGDTILSVPQVKQQDRALLKAKEWWNGVRPDMRAGGRDSAPVRFIPVPIVQRG